MVKSVFFMFIKDCKYLVTKKAEFIQIYDFSSGDSSHCVSRQLNQKIRPSDTSDVLVAWNSATCFGVLQATTACCSADMFLYFPLIFLLQVILIYFLYSVKISRQEKNHFSLFLFQPTNAQIYITQLSLCIMFTSTCFDISMSSSGSFKNLCLVKLHKFLKLRLLKWLYHKIVRLKYINILFGYRWLAQ
jgi:hypothetical protein